MSEFSEIFKSTWAIVLMIVFFGGSIFVHEFGHFLAAKWRGLKVTRFSIGFGPRLFSWKGKDGCEYMVSLLPFGGYVALPQLADMGRLEGGDAKDESGENEDTRLAKSLPKISYLDKVIVSSAGAFFNILFALLIAVFVWIFGVPSYESQNTTVLGYVPQKIFENGVEIDSPAYLAGLREGDKILKIDGAKVRNFSGISELVAVGSGRDKDGNPLVKVSYERDGKVSEVDVRPILVSTNLKTGDELRMLGIYPASALKVSSVEENSPAKKAGLLVGDIIEKFNGKKVYSNYEVVDRMKSLPSGEAVKLNILRDEKPLEISAVPAKIAISKPLCELSSKDFSEPLKFICVESKGQDPTSEGAKGSVFLYEKPAGDSRLAELLPGDRLVSINGENISSLSDIKRVISSLKPGENPTLLLMNQSSTAVKNLALGTGAAAKIKEPLTRNMLGYVVSPQRIILHPGVWEQFVDNVDRTWNALVSLLSPSSDIGLRHLSGPIGIGRVMYKFSLMDITLVLSFVVLININLAILNMLPIPVLDGGHIVIATIAKLRKKPLPESWVAGVQGVFMLLFLGMMLYVVYFDIMRWSGENMEENSFKIEQAYYLKDIKFK